MFRHVNRGSARGNRRTSLRKVSRAIRRDGTPSNPAARHWRQWGNYKLRKQGFLCSSGTFHHGLSSCSQPLRLFHILTQPREGDSLEREYAKCCLSRFIGWKSMIGPECKASIGYYASIVQPQLGLITSVILNIPPVHGALRARPIHHRSIGRRG